GGVVQPTPVALANAYDLGHSHQSFVAMCNPVGNACQMNGAESVSCGPPAACPPMPQFKYVANDTGILNPYLQLATQFGWANLMFQTNQGPSFPAHQFIFGATSAPDSISDTKGIFASENMLKTGIGGTQAKAGCEAAPTTYVSLIKPPGVETDKMHPCFEHKT